MLVPFTMSPGCMQPLGIDVPSARARVKELRYLWKHAGVLVVDAEDRLVRCYYDRLRAEPLPGWLRRLWQDVLMELSDRVLNVRGWAGPGMGQMCQPEDILPAQSLVIHLSERGVWGFGDSESSRMIGERVEVCRLDCLPDSGFARAIHESGGTVKKKASTIEVLNRFELPSAIAKSVVMIDPYIGKEEVVKPEKSGGRRFILYLASIRSSAATTLQSLTVYTAKDVARSMSDKTIVGREDVLTAWKAVRDAIPLSSIAEFRLRLVNADRFASVAHDRFVRFGDFTIQVGAGFAIFEGKRLTKRTTILPVRVEEAKELEQELRSEASYEEILL